MTARLIEAILSAGHQILEDAEGSSYMDEIETLHEKLGGRLNSINVMIANLSVFESSGQEPESSTEDSPSSAVKTDETEQSESPKPASFALFAEQIAATSTVPDNRCPKCLRST